MREFRRLAVLLLLFLLRPAALHSQAQRTVGVHVGRVRAEQLWEAFDFGTPSTGISAGVQVDVPTPARGLSIRAGIGYLQRGAGVWDPDHDLKLNLRNHYLNLPVEGKLGLSLGPVSLYVLAGPAVDLLLGTQCSQDLCAVLRDERPTVLSANLGAGLAISFQDRIWGDLEVRLNEGLTSAHSSGGEDLRYRSVETLFRARFPF